MKARDDVSRTAGREALAAAGIGEDETTPAALMPLTGRRPEIDATVVERLARAPSDDRAAALRALATSAAEHGWKAVAKEARRALYRFAQRGIAVPPPPSPPAAAPRIRPTTVEGLLSPIDGRGDRLVWLVRAKPEGGLLVMTAVLNEPGGLREVTLAEMPRKTLRRMAHDLHTRHHLRMVAADGPYCDALLAEGFARARAAGAAGVGEYPTLRMRLVTTDPIALDPPLVAGLLGEVDPADAAGAAALLDQPEFVTWRLERAVLEPYLAEITEARESPLLLSPAQREERVHGIVARALRQVFSGSTAAAYRRRLEEMAYYLYATARQPLARAALASASQLKASAHGGADVAFLEELTRRSFAALTAADAAQARADAETSLIVRPSAARPAGPPRPRGR